MQRKDNEEKGELCRATAGGRGLSCNPSLRGLRKRELRLECLIRLVSATA